MQPPALRPLFEWDADARDPIISHHLINGEARSSGLRLLMTNSLISRRMPTASSLFLASRMAQQNICLMKNKSGRRYQMWLNLAILTSNMRTKVELSSALVNPV